MSTSLVVVILFVIAVAGFLAARARSLSVVSGDASKLHSRPNYYGAYIAIFALLPALFLYLVIHVSGAMLVEHSVKSQLPAEVLAKTPDEQNVIYGMISSIAGGFDLLSEAEKADLAKDISKASTVLGSHGVPLAEDPEPYMMTLASMLSSESHSLSVGAGLAAILASLLGAGWAYSKIRPVFRARNNVERVMLAALVLSSTIAILTTFGIVGSLISETIHFFSQVSPWNFFFGTVWDPRFSAQGSTDSSGQFGLIPLLLGTLYIAFVAMLIAVPIGLFAAIYMSEYASRVVRSTVKPLLEVLAGIPTIVYGFFALVTVGPLLRDFSADLWGALTGNYVGFIQAQSVLTAGLVMSIRLIPFVSSLSDDIITAVPRAMRDGSLGLGATRSETMKRVILPAALPGIVGALLLTASRAIGETMIVVLAAGVAANLQFSPFEPMTTVTVKIVNQLTGDLVFNSPQTLVAFALGMTLFVITLALNVYALYIVRKYREQYE
jgi:phosphate transport system permease protein